MKTIPFQCLCVCLLAAATSVAQAGNLDTSKIEQLTGLKGTFNTNEGVFKITVLRNDVKVSVDDWTMPPFRGLASWAAFTDGKMNDAMVMGDNVLFQDEVNPVMSVALDNGLSVTALHNHFFYDEPKVYFMHIGGEGSVEQLATAIRKVWDKVKEIRAANPQPAVKFGGTSLPAQSSITGKAIEDILGVKGQSNNGMFKVVIGRTTKMPCGCEMGKEMGVNTWAAFAGTDDNALVDGDFAVLEAELQPVLKSLRHDGINIVAIHSHMTQENPRILFLHYWGKGRAADLARSLKAALGPQNETVHFDNDKAGALPSNWLATKTGAGNPRWAVFADDTAPSKPNVLKQSGEADYPVALKDDTSLKDGFVEVKFKPVSGKVDQAGGVIWRAKDADNYYIARANALEDNVTIYHTIKGSRVAFKNVNHPVKSGVWHTLRVEFQGNHFTAAFDGEKVIEVTDDSFSDAGKVGVWTKADSVTMFDDFSYGAK